MWNIVCFPGVECGIRNYDKNPRGGFRKFVSWKCKRDRCEHIDENIPTTITSQKRLTTQILKHWRPFQVLQQTFTVSTHTDQFRLRVQQCIVVTTEDSVCRTEMVDLESQEENPKYVLYYQPMTLHSCLGVILSEHRSEVWSFSLRQNLFTFVCVDCSLIQNKFSTLGR